MFSADLPILLETDADGLTAGDRSWLAERDGRSIDRSRTRATIGWLVGLTAFVGSWALSLATGTVITAFGDDGPSASFAESVTFGHLIFTPLALFLLIVTAPTARSLGLRRAGTPRAVSETAGPVHAVVVEPVGRRVAVALTRDGERIRERYFSPIDGELEAAIDARLEFESEAESMTAREAERREAVRRAEFDGREARIAAWREREAAPERFAALVRGEG